MSEIHDTHRSSFFSSRAWRSLRSRASWKTCRTSWASRTTLTRRTLEYHHKAAGRSDKTSEEYKHEVTKAENCTHSRSRWTMRTLISFQAMSSLQNRAEPKTSVMEETSNILFVLHNGLDRRLLHMSILLQHWSIHYLCTMEITH